MNESSAEMLWAKFIASNQHIVSKNIKYEAYHFCNDETSANELAALVKNGTKTATSSLYYLYDDCEEIPKKGDYSIILDWYGKAHCIIQNIEVCLVPFDKVSEMHAYKEGEGDKSLAYWKKVHEQFFKDELSDKEKVFSPEMLVVCEEFHVVYKGI